MESLRSVYPGQTKVALETLGCKLNQAESELISKQLEEAGFMLVDSVEQADICLLNTCTVTHVADRKARHILQMNHRRNPHAKLVALGCYAERAAGDLSAIPGVDLVVNNHEKNNLVKLLDKLNDVKTKVIIPARRETGRTRTFVKAQDGCSNYCTYCIVPFVRGSEKSLLPDEVIREINDRVDKGYQEIVLTGTEIGKYQCEGIGLSGLLERILAETKIKRLRLSSLQPREVTSELIGLWQDERLCSHFHLALQSGSDSVLQRMGRCYLTRDYAAAAELIRSRVPDAAITTDVIVGFPGETGAEFSESLDFCRRMRFARIHVFSYSARQGTAAARLPDRVKGSEKKRRSAQMLELGARSLAAFHSLYAGKTLAVLFEGSKKNLWLGYTGNYLKVQVESGENLTNRIMPVKLFGRMRDGMNGELV
ncbi:MAG TPA: tRNA (N(6)-L-threonylcarbamoyladenosine(37)-C(2))-methylthiotransferase MtaB [Dehalococcoidales bacterium]